MAMKFNNATQVGRESAQALLDALLVADIGKDIPEDCYLRRFPGGYMQTRLRHERQQAYGLQSHRLTTSIGASNYYHEEFAPQVKVDGYNLPVSNGWRASRRSIRPSVFRRGSVERVIRP